MYLCLISICIKGYLKPIGLLFFSLYDSLLLYLFTAFELRVAQTNNVISLANKLQLIANYFNN